MTQKFHSQHRMGQNASVVVVDPNPISLLALAGALHGHGFQCVCAKTVEAAISATSMGIHDLYVWDVGPDAPGAVRGLTEIREHPDHNQVPAILIAESRWAGLEKKAESMPQPTRCLFKPIDPHVLLAVADHSLWMPSLVDSHRQKGSRPNRPGWITLNSKPA